VRCLAFALASLAIATEHCPTRAPSSPRGRLPQSRRRRPGRTARHRGRPDRLAADPVFTPATASRQQPGALTTPRPARSADVLPRLRPGITGRRSPPSTARRGRRRRLVAGFPNREDEGRTHCPSSRAARPADGRSRLHACNRFPPATRRADHATASPICRCAASSSPWHHWPAIATEHCPTRAPSSPRGRLPQSRGRRPDQLPDELHALDHSNASLPTSE
jgi:hypothetical protein